MTTGRTILIVVLGLLLVLHLLFGTLSTTHSEYSSGVGVYNEYMNGAVRLLFPLIVTVLGAVPLYDQLSRNFIAFTRTRSRLTFHVLSLVGAGIVRNCVYFGVLGITTTIAATFLAPALNSALIKPHDYGLTAAQALSQQATQNPIGAAIRGGTLLYGLAASVWMVVASAIFSCVAASAVLVIRRRALALLAPFGLLLVESILAEVLGAPSFTLLLDVPVPSSLQSFPLWQAVIAPLGVGVVAVAAGAIALRRSYRIGDFS